MNILRRIIATLLAATATSTLIVAACIVALLTSLISPQTWLNAANNERLVDDLLPLALPELIEVAATSPIGPGRDAHAESLAILEQLPPDELADLTRRIVPRDWLVEHLTQALAVVEAIARGDEARLTQSINLNAIRNGLDDLYPSVAAADILQRLPPCTVSEIVQIRAAESAANTLPLCGLDPDRNPPAYDVVKWHLEEAIRNLTAALPTEVITLAEFYALSDQAIRVIELTITTSNQLLSLLYLLPATLLSLVVALVVRSPRSFGRWFGMVGIAVGSVLLVILVVWQLIALGSVIDLLRLDRYAESFGIRIVGAVIRSLLSVSSTMLLLQAIIALILGSGLFAASIFGRTTSATTS